MMDWFAAALAAAALVCGAICAHPASAQGAGGPVVVAGSNEDPNPGPAGKMPYEMEGRREPHKPLFDMQDVSGWALENWGVDARLHRTREQRLWLPYAAKVAYKANAARDSHSFLLRPSAPIPLPDPWDVFEFWGWGNGGVTAVIEGADGKRTEVWMGSTDAHYWFLLHARVGPEVKRPARLVGLRFHKTDTPTEKAVYIGPGYAFKEELKPLTYAPWPKKLPFPTRPQTILPPNKTKAFTNALRRQGDTWVFGYAGDDARLEYAYTPRDGTLGDVTLSHGDRTLRPMAGGGARLVTPHGVLEPGDPKVTHELVGVRRAGDTVRATWRLSADGAAVTMTYAMRMRQKSLIVDFQADAPVVAGIDLGRTEGVTHPRLFRVPYLTFGGDDPRVLYADGLFGFTQFDWYNSDASMLFAARIGADAGSARFNGGADYSPKTDGVRNPVRERLFVTFSPDVQEVLPAIPNPPSPYRAMMADRLWRVKHGEDYAVEIAEARRFAAYGMDRVACRYHEEQWRDGDESFTFRLNAAPGRGGDRALQETIKAIRDVGWLYGLYTNFTDLATVNANWDPDHASRTPTGGYQSSWWRCYAPKPNYAVEAAAYYAPRIAAKFGTNHSYCDVHTAVTPFSRVDFDARVPGAGMFRRTFECFGRLLYEQKFAYQGPVYSEGINHWWYTGLTDGNYAQIASGASWKDPLFVDFDLLRMHPLAMDAGMGEIGMFYRGPLPELAIERFRATGLAYGHIGYLDYQTHASTWPELIKTYYLLQPLQQHYVMVPVRTIEYADAEGRLMDTSRALVADAHLNNRVHVVYQTGFHVWVNGSPVAWEVPGPNGPVRLPEWGYLAHTADGKTVSMSALAPGKDGAAVRVEASLAPGMAYLDSRGAGRVTVGPLTVDGAVALKRDGRAWWVYPATSAREFALDLRALGIAGSPTVTAWTEAGGEAPAPTFQVAGATLRVEVGDTGPFKFRISARSATR